MVQLFNIPGYYVAEFGLDLKLISRENNLPPDRMIRLYPEPTFRLYFIDFLPGFLLLEGLEKNVGSPGKFSPGRFKKQQLGSAKIRQEFTRNPVPWMRILGNSPEPLFDTYRLPSWEISERG